MPMVYGPDLLDDAADLLLAGCLPPGVAGAIITGSGSLLAGSQHLPAVDPLLDGWSPTYSVSPIGPLPHHVWPSPLVDKALRDRALYDLAVCR
jgi:hypothetical protein